MTPVFFSYFLSVILSAHLTPLIVVRGLKQFWALHTGMTMTSRGRGYILLMCLCLSQWRKSSQKSLCSLFFTLHWLELCCMPMPSQSLARAVAHYSWLSSIMIPPSDWTMGPLDLQYKTTRGRWIVPLKLLKMRKMVMNYYWVGNIAVSDILVFIFQGCGPYLW